MAKHQQLDGLSKEQNLELIWDEFVSHERCATDRETVGGAGKLKHRQALRGTGRLNAMLAGTCGMQAALGGGLALLSSVLHVNSHTVPILTALYLASNYSNES